MNGDGKLELEIMLRVANSAQLQTLGEVEVDIMASLREHPQQGGVSVQLTALHANMALGRVLREIANRVDPPTPSTDVAADGIKSGLARLQSVVDLVPVIDMIALELYRAHSIDRTATPFSEIGDAARHSWTVSARQLLERIALEGLTLAVGREPEPVIVDDVVRRIHDAGRFTNTQLLTIVDAALENVIAAQKYEIARELELRAARLRS